MRNFIEGTLALAPLNPTRIIREPQDGKEVKSEVGLPAAFRVGCRDAADWAIELAVTGRGFYLGRPSKNDHVVWTPRRVGWIRLRFNGERMARGRV